jgi:hypothetical protein
MVEEEEEALAEEEEAAEEEEPDEEEVSTKPCTKGNGRYTACGTHVIQQFENR